MSKTFVMGDIHGAHKALIQCLERSGFDYDNDTLIQLGDVCDGWMYVYECVNTLLSIKNLIAIRGNHDEWFQQFIERGRHPDYWQQGGAGTLFSYCRGLGLMAPYKLSGEYKHSLSNTHIPLAHQIFFTEEQRNYYKDDKGRIFVHGGFNRHQPLEGQLPHRYYWDRDLWSLALSVGHVKIVEGMPEPKFKIAEPCTEIYIGHTSTKFWDKDVPMQAAGKVWNLDTGAGWDGKLTIMDIDTKQFWQSDPVEELYPNERGRK